MKTLPIAAMAWPSLGLTGFVPDAWAGDSPSLLSDAGIATAREGGAIVTGSLTDRVRFQSGERDAGGLSGLVVRFDRDGDTP